MNTTSESSPDSLLSPRDLTTPSIAELSRILETADGPARMWAYRNLALLSTGYYSSDEVIELARSTGSHIYDPFTRIRRGTRIGANVTIDEGSAIEGANVVLGDRTRLRRAFITGSNVAIGSASEISGEIGIDDLTVGNANHIVALTGKNTGRVKIGHRNSIIGVRIANLGGGIIEVGNDNELCQGLNLNIPFGPNTLFIGHKNSLGRDGGGVISTSYRFGRKWGGDIVIGAMVQTTRGAEVLGFSVVGYPESMIRQFAGLSPDMVVRLFVEDSLAALVSRLFEPLLSDKLHCKGNWADTCKPVSLFGTVKVKRCFLTGKVTLKDDTRIQSSYLRDVLIPERCTVHYTTIEPEAGKILVVSAQGRAFDHTKVTQDQEWNAFPTVAKADDYPPTDADFYKDYS